MQQRRAADSRAGVDGGQVNASRTRVVAVVLIVVAFIALAAFALLARAYRPGRSGVRVPSAMAAQITQSAAAEVPAGAVLGTRIEATESAAGPSTEAAPSISSVPASQ